MLKLRDDRNVWTLSAVRDGDTIRYGMASRGAACWEASHTLPQIALEFNRSLREKAMLAASPGASAGCAQALMEDGGVLHSLAVPVDMRGRMPPAGSALQIVTNEQGLLFELFHDGEGFWCGKYALARLPNGGQPAQAGGLEQPAGTQCLLLAGQEGAGPAACMGRRGVECERVQPEHVTGKELLIRLNSGKYGIFHYSGAIAQAGGDAAIPLAGGTFVKLRDIAGLAGLANAVVFLDGYGTAEALRKGEAANPESAAAQFLRAGARAVVCARWKANDAAAGRFAESFYERVLNGETFGTALMKARRDTSRIDASCAWAAYALYGNPALSFAKPQENGPPEAFKTDGTLNLAALSGELRASLEAAYEMSIMRSPLSTTHWFIGFLLRGGGEARELFHRLDLPHEQAGRALAAILLKDSFPVPVELATMRPQEFSANTYKAVVQAVDIAVRQGRRKATNHDVLSAMLDMNCSMNVLFQPLGLDAGRVCKALEEMPGYLPAS